MTPRRLSVLLFVAALLLVGCSGDRRSATPERGDASTPVAIVSFDYAPRDIDIAVGTTVTWTNEDAFAHTVTGGTPDDPTGPEGVMGELGDMNGRGETFSWTLEEAGTYEYFCRFHPGQMRGTVTVAP